MMSQSSPFIHLLESKGRKFVLDLHTNRMFSLSLREAQVFEKWLNGTELRILTKEYHNEVTTIENLRLQGLFCSEQPIGLAFGADWDTICDKILHERERTLIEITQNCNLRCKYCTFHGGFKDHRVHRSLVMSEEVLKSTIANASQFGDRLEEISVGFYGGEPLSYLRLLKSAVFFAQRISSRKKIRFSITTNATLIDKTKARFLRDAEFSVLVSIDGPKYMHDRYRVFPNGKGSYDEAIRGLRVLLDVYPQHLHSKIGLNMVVPAFGWIKKLEELWENEPWLPRTIRAVASIMIPPDSLDISHLSSKLGRSDLCQEWLLSFERPRKELITPTSNIFDNSMLKIHRRSLFDAPRSTFFPNGCCIPGVQKVYVTADGEYRMCERAHGVPPIGTVDTGIDFGKIRHIIEEYCSRSFLDCRTCWAISICRLCFKDAYESGHFTMEKKRRACSAQKKSLSEDLTVYCMTTLDYPEKLKEWDTMTTI